MNRATSKFLVSATAVLAMAVGCGGAASTAVSSDESFVSTPKNAAATSAPAEEFYIVLNKKELGQKWFLSAYMKQLFPGAVAYGAAQSLGTKVVSFKIYNGKMFVVDASNTKATSSTFDPTLIVDAYPVITDATLLKKYPADKWVIFDPAAGLNNFGVVGDYYGGAGYEFKTELSFAQNFASTTDGVVWEQVFTGYSNIPDANSWKLGENNQLRASGTLGLALRRYTESPGFTAAPYPSDDFYFYGDLQLVKNTGQATAPIVKWHVKPGMKPIQWIISNQILETEKAYGGKYDLQGAIKAAVENWNGAFGFKVLEAKIGNANDSYGDDTKNMILWDLDPSNGYAFANWRTNPITGELRGASVYMNAMWVDDADQYWPDDNAVTKTTGTKVKRVAQPKAPMLRWNAMPPQSLCKAWAPRYRGDADFAAAETNVADPAATVLTKKQKVEQFLTHVVLHEIGHTLGLRHNFKGSMTAKDAARPSTSVMDYLTNEDSVPMFTPGDYDVAAVKFLYGQSGAEPTQKFCNDSGVGVDPNCETFDRTDDPLNKYHGLYYTAYLNYFYKTQNIFALLYWDYWLNNVLNYVRAGGSQGNAALALTINSFTAPISPDVLKQPSMGAMLDLVAEWTYARMYVDPASYRGDIKNDPGATISQALIPQFKLNLANAEGFRSYETRRMMVDILKKLQDLKAYDALVTSRVQIAASRASLTGADAELTDDLLARIDAAVHPYFVY